MKTVNTKKYISAQGIDDVLQDVGGGIAQGGRDKVQEYIARIVGMIQQGEQPQQAFETVMAGIPPTMRKNVAQGVMQQLNTAQPAAAPTKPPPSLSGDMAALNQQAIPVQ